jgi:hypothetical protein
VVQIRINDGLGNVTGFSFTITNDTTINGDPVNIPFHMPGTYAVEYNTDFATWLAAGTLTVVAT